MRVREIPPKVWHYIRQLFAQPAPSTSPANEQPLPEPGGQTPSQASEQPSEPRYDVQDASGHSLAKANDLTDAHRQWKRKTGQNGRIIDTKTNQDVTPPKDDDGRYVVLDENNQQVSSHARKQDALDAWREETGEKGKVIDLLTK